MATKETKPPVNLVMTVDLGGSKTKIVAQELGSDLPQVLLMDSELADFDAASLDSLPKQGRTSDRAWVGFDKSSFDDSQSTETKYYAVGTLARVRLGGLPQLHELKYELALPKILAAVWLAKVEMSLPAKFNLYLNILLPSGEMSDSAILKSRLISCLKSFDSPDGKIRIKLNACEVSAEGSGIYTFRKNELGDEIYSKTQLYVMLGFRNASAFVIRSGVPEPGNTSDFGMYWMLDLLASRVSGLNKNDPKTIETIIKSADKPELLKKLSRKRSAVDIEADFVSITEALELSKDEYVRAIVRWLKSLGTAEEILFCGGTAEYLRPELENYYSNEITEIVWHGGVSLPSEVESLLGGYRLADVWASHPILFDIATKLVLNTKTAARKKNKQLVKEEKLSNLSNDNQKPATYKSFVPEIKVNRPTTTSAIKYEATERPADTLPPIVN